MGIAKVNGSVEMLAAVDPITAFELFDPKIIEGSKSDLNDVDTIAIFKDVARDKNLKLGDKVPAVFKDAGEKQLTVAMIYGEDRPAGDYVLGMPTYEANFANRYDMQLFVKKAANVSTADAMAAVKAVVSDYPGVTVLDQQGYKDAQAAPINQMLALVYALLALAIVIALLGIGNTLALSIFERTRELGLLRAVGMTRSQLRSTIRWESVIIAMQGTVLGLLIGLFFGWSLVRALSDEGIDQFSAPIRSLTIVVVLAWLAGVVAAILPGRRAAKLDVLKAVVTE
jgi:putative ABC transport system permease protein